MASYRLLIKRSAARELEAIVSRGDRRRIVRRIRDLSGDPPPPGCEKLTGEDRCRVRQGWYRIVYTVDDRARTVLIVKVGHRRDVYR